MRSVLFCGLLLSMAGCDRRVAQPTGRSDVPQRQIDLGELAVVPQGHDFTVAVRNVGGTPMRVTKIDLSCACTSAGDFNPLIEAGETVEIPLHVNPKGAGPGGTAVTVTTDELPPRAHRVDVVWTGVAAVEAEPLYVDFGNVRPGTDEVRTVAVRRRDPQTVVSNWVATPIERVAVEQGDDTATIRIHAGDEFGEYSGTATAEVKGAWPPMLRIPVRWTVRDVFDVSPQRLFLGTLTSGETVERQIVVTADKDGSIQDVTVRIEGLDNLKATAELRSPTSAHVRVEWTGTATEGAHAGALLIDVVGSESRTLRVPVSVFVGTATELTAGVPAGR